MTMAISTTRRTRHSSSRGRSRSRTRSSRRRWWISCACRPRSRDAELLAGVRGCVRAGRRCRRS